MKQKKTSAHKNFFDKTFSLPATEERVLKYWKKNDIFEKSVAINQKKGKRPFVFYEGPPYANGKPGIHHVLARIYKDVVLRYKTMRGDYVPRRGGWDSHGLPVEIAAEKALGLTSKKDIEKFGIALFNKKAKESVWIYKNEWEKMTDRIGYWLDLKNAYITYEAEYIETLWWILKRLWDKKIFFKGNKVVPWCTRCGTSLSSHELAQGYKERVDASVYVKFRLIPGINVSGGFKTTRETYILSWTTTPWTLPGNVALAVGVDIMYGLYRGVDGAYLICAVDRAEAVFEKAMKPEKTFTGSSLARLRYEPLFNVPKLRSTTSYSIYPARFVTTTEGTGVVHTAVMYGEDDYELGIRENLPRFHTVSEEGVFVRGVPGLSGKPVKAQDTENIIIASLSKKRFFFRKEDYTHEYPHCWRCESPILYYARTSWFIGMEKLRSRLLAENRKINWKPEHVKNGRFGEWLREAKDWNVSRERYWGTPLPVWECDACGATDVMGGINELCANVGTTKNKYWIMRHGHAESLLANVIDSGKGRYHLTDTGKKQAQKAAESLRKHNIDVIVSSDVLRTRETALIAAKTLGVKRVIIDKQIREIFLGVLEGKRPGEYFRTLPSYESRFESAPDKGETLRELRARVWSAIRKLETDLRGKRILLVSHEYPLWMLSAAALGWSEKKAIDEKKAQSEERNGDFISPGEARPLGVRMLPRDETGLIDLHRPYVDTISYLCSEKKCRGTKKRVREVADVWFDAGSMPFAQHHYPFENKLFVDKQGGYPADYIAEGMDQTRGWFYTLLAVAVALGKAAPYKNVASLGLINDTFGKKMSKSKGNIIEPMSVIDQYGADAVRWYFFTVNAAGDAKNFDTADVQKAFRKFHMILYNSLVFYETYADTASTTRISRNILDTWLMARLRETSESVCDNFDTYDIREAALAIEKVVDDLSRWYIRRSRRRFQRPASRAELLEASGTLRHALSEIAKMTAPFTPFFAEALYKKFGDSESVHLDSLKRLNVTASDKKIITNMAEVRRLARMALAKRAELGIKVRQPLASLHARNKKSEIQKDKRLLNLLASEVNVKKIVFHEKIDAVDGGEVAFDTVITPKLKEEGALRELVRTAQDLRQKAGLEPKDSIALFLELPEPMRGIAARNEAFLKKEIGAREIQYKKSEKVKAGAKVDFDGEKAWFGIRKVK